jgi:hypothetical protein
MAADRRDSEPRREVPDRDSAPNRDNVRKGGREYEVTQQPRPEPPPNPPATERNDRD